MSEFKGSHDQDGKSIIEASANENRGFSVYNNIIAIVVAISAAFVTIVNIKDNNVVQAMSQEQARAIDSWSYYQAKGTKQNLAESAKNALEMQLLVQDEKIKPAVKSKMIDAISKYEQKMQKYELEKVEIKAQAEGHQNEYERLNTHDDQFDMSEALISLAMAILGLAALTQKKWLVFVGILASSCGVLMGVAGFLELNIHPEWLAKFLG